MDAELIYAAHWSARRKDEQNARYAALLDALTTTGGAGAYFIHLIRGAVKRGLIVSETDRTPTDFGRTWRAGWHGTPAPLASITVYSRMAADHGHKPTPKPSTVARDLMAAGLVFVHPKLIDDLSTEELALWIKAKRHERDGLTLAALAALLGEPLAHVRIRAERIVAKGYVVAVRDDGGEEAA